MAEQQIEEPPLYARIAPNGGRYHIVDPTSTEEWTWLSYCGANIEPSAVTAMEGVEFAGHKFLSLCPKCKRAQKDAKEKEPTDG